MTYRCTFTPNCRHHNESRIIGKKQRSLEMVVFNAFPRYVFRGAAKIDLFQSIPRDGDIRRSTSSPRLQKNEAS